MNLVFSLCYRQDLSSRFSGTQDDTNENILTNMHQQLVDALEEIRPYLALHAGDVELVKFEEGVVYIKMLGTCDGCPLASLTITQGIEEMLRLRVRGVERVEAV